jgi:hypothetical protein
MVKKILTFAFGIILVVSFIGVSFGFYNMGKKSVENSQGVLGKRLNEYSDEYSQYSVGTLVLGEEVLSLINEDMEVTVKVKTGADSTGKAYTAASSAEDIAKAKNRNGNEYINPYKNFKCTGVDRNSNGVINVLEFTQQ